MDGASREDERGVMTLRIQSHSVHFMIMNIVHGESILSSTESWPIDAYKCTVYSPVDVTTLDIMTHENPICYLAPGPISTHKAVNVLIDCHHDTCPIVHCPIHVSKHGHHGKCAIRVSSYDSNDTCLTWHLSNTCVYKWSAFYISNTCV